MKKILRTISALLLLAAASCFLFTAATAYEVGHEKHAYIGMVQFDHSKIKEAPISVEELIRQAAPGPNGVFEISHNNEETMKIYDAMELVRYPRQWSPTTEQNEAYWGLGMTQDWQPTRRLYLQKQIYGG